MREILFRGKRVDNGEWVEGFYIFDNADKQPRVVIDRDYSTGTFFHANAPRVESETVGQYTGLTDKNGKKIFEGDIVKLYKELFKIIFKYSEWKLEIISKRIFMSPYFHSHAEQCEIVGNIHDTTELLQEEK